MNRYAIYGASGCGRGVMPLARAQLRAANGEPWDLVFIDDRPAASIVNGCRVMNYGAWLKEPAKSRQVSIAIADPGVRAEVAARCVVDGVCFFEIRASNVVVLDDVTIGTGAILCPFVTLTSNVRIGQHFHGNLYSYVEHDCVIGDFVTFAPGAKCNGNVVIEDYVYIGAGAILRQGRPGEPLVIGRGAVVGMGAVVTKSVAAGSTVVGNPAQVRHARRR